MSASTLIQSAGLAILKVTDGEALTLVIDANTQVSVTGIIDWDILWREFNKVSKSLVADFQINGITKVEIVKDDLDNAPESGQVFLDSISYRHRIRFVTQTDVSWVCYCSPSKVKKKLTNLKDVLGDDILDTKGNSIVTS